MWHQSVTASKWRISEAASAERRNINQRPKSEEENRNGAKAWRRNERRKSEGKTWREEKEMARKKKASMKIMACAKPLKWLMKAAAKRRRNGERS
jgi:hypothetical protein